MRYRRLTLFILVPCLLLLRPTQGLPDVSPGDVLDKTNWEKAEGLLPDEIIGWIKKGDFVLRVGELNYFINQARYFESEDKEFHFPHVGDQVMIDERLGHATIFRGPMPADIWDYFAEQEADDFSLAGFQKFCK